MKLKSIIVAAALAWAAPAIAQGPGGGGPGPGPTPSPWIVNGPTISYNNGGITLPASVTGGTKGIGTINLQNGYYEAGVRTRGIASVTAPIAFTAGDVSLNIDANFAVVTNNLALASIASGSLIANAGAGLAEPTGTTPSAWFSRWCSASADRVAYSTGASTWGCLQLLGASHTWTAAQTINLNAASAPAAIAGTGILVSPADATVGRVQVNAYGAIASFTGAIYGGTAASPTQVLSGTQLTGVNAYAYTGSALVGPIASFRTYAAENIGATAWGTKACIATTPSTTAVLADSLCQQNSGGITIGSPTGGDKGAGTINSAGTIYINNVAVTAAAITSLTTDVVATGPGAAVATIQAGVVTYAKFQTVAASSLVGNPTGSLATSQAVSIGATLAFSGTALQTAAGTGDVTWSANSFVTTLATAQPGAHTWALGQTFSSAMTYGGVTLANSVSGTGSMALTISPTFTGTLNAAAGAFTSTLTSAAHAITSASANALVVGLNGATNPALQVDASTALSATGLKVKSAAAAAGVAVSVITSGTNENLTIDAAGSGTITFGATSTGAIIHTRATTLAAALTYGGVTFNNTVTGSGNLVGSVSPTFTGTLAAAAITATTLNGNTFTTGTYTLTGVAGKTLTFNNTMTFAGTDGQTYTFPSVSATITRTIASGSSALNTSAIGSTACNTTTVVASGVASTDTLGASFNGSTAAITGYAPLTTGGLSIRPYPSAGNVNFEVCNGTGTSITPGALTLNWEVTR